MRLLTILFFFVIISGCASTYKTDSYVAPVHIMKVNASAYIMMAEDGNYGSIPYPGSGNFLSSATRNAVLFHLKRVEKATHVETIEAALSRAKEMRLTYVFNPTILHWEDRATEWSGKLDRIAIKLIVLDVESGKNISSSVLSAASKWATFGGDHPEDLLSGTITPYINKLFNK
jgi:hypothetical protein